MNSDVSDASSVVTVASSDRADKFRRHFELCCAVALGDQPGNPRAHFVELLAHHLQAGLRLGGVEPQQQIARGDPLPLWTGISATTPPVGCWMALTFD